MACFFFSIPKVATFVGVLAYILGGRGMEAKEILQDESNNDFEDLDTFDVDIEEMSIHSTKDSRRAAFSGDDVQKHSDSVISISHCPTAPIAKIATEFSARLRHVYKHVDVEEIAELSPAPMQHLASVATASQYAMMAYCWAGRKISAQLGWPVPGWFGVIEQSPMTPMAVLYFLGKRLQNYILGTGGFEVTVDGKLIWSMRTSGRIPSWQELLFQLQEAGLPTVEGADDESKFTSGWQDEQDEAAATVLSGYPQ
eukprot:m.427546 g.427546  ORF g.427546 m.427546 type:complete len:255 (-) comp21363_c1_seq3:541-1305(-)